MIVKLDLPEVMLPRISAWLEARIPVIDGHTERIDAADYVMTQAEIAMGREIRDKKRKKSKISKEPKAPC
jgi:hypothetical protein